MFNGSMPGRRLPVICLSSSLALVACASGATEDPERAVGAPLRAHETSADGAVHHHPDAKPWDGGVQTVPAPPGCAPNTFDAIQAQIFDSPTYGCTAAGCHGSAATGLDLRPHASYAGLLGLPLAHHEGHAHAPANHEEGEEHGDDHAHDEGAEHEHEAGEAHPHEDGAEHDHDRDADEDHDHDEGGAHAHPHLVPGNPEASVLYDRLRAGVQGTTPTLGGMAMPLGKPPITRDLLNAVAAWIRAGAPQVGFVAGTERALCRAAPDAGTPR